MSLIGWTEQILQDLACRDSGHDDHGTKGDILKNHRHAVVAAIPGHHLGLGAKVAEIIGWRDDHWTATRRRASD